MDNGNFRIKILLIPMIIPAVIPPQIPSLVLFGLRSDKGVFPTNLPVKYAHVSTNAITNTMIIAFSNPSSVFLINKAKGNVVQIIVVFRIKE